MVLNRHVVPQKVLERPEEVDELRLFQLKEESAEEMQVRGEWYEDTDGDTEEDGTDLRVSEHYGDERLNSTDEALKNSRVGAGKVDLANEIAMLTYRNGLLFDVKTDSS